ncbi:MAG: type II toxin-antitoxin system RelE/ParE family toxin [Acidobacteria bacterium]|nr:type II toxin-antitoxin system RelE/ParE family toxin [Acidobacteriota bacterium]
MNAFALHPGAFDDLAVIRRDVAEDNPDAADRLVLEILNVIRTLVPFPHLGFQRPQLTSRPLRFTVVREYVIAYAPDHKPLLVVAVIHGRRSPRVMAALLRGRE